MPHDRWREWVAPLDGEGPIAVHLHESYDQLKSMATDPPRGLYGRLGSKGVVVVVVVGGWVSDHKARVHTSVT